jgi:hypothetical protein
MNKLWKEKRSFNLQSEKKTRKLKIQKNKEEEFGGGARLLA